jgi:hypothetical protein
MEEELLRVKRERDELEKKLLEMQASQDAKSREIKPQNHHQQQQQHQHQHQHRQQQQQQHLAPPPAPAASSGPPPADDKRQLAHAGGVAAGRGGRGSGGGGGGGRGSCTAVNSTLNNTTSIFNLPGAALHLADLPDFELEHDSVDAMAEAQRSAGGAAGGMLRSGGGGRSSAASHIPHIPAGGLNARADAASAGVARHADLAFGRAVCGHLCSSMRMYTYI